MANDELTEGALEETLADAPATEQDKEQGEDAQVFAMPTAKDLALERVYNSEFADATINDTRLTNPRFLAEGGQGTSFTLDGSRENEFVARLTQKNPFHENLYERIRNEVRVQNKLHHPNVAAGGTLFETDGWMLYLRPFIEGESIRKRMNSGKPFQIGEVVSTLDQILDALDYSHHPDKHGETRGSIAHRDIKAENVIVDDDGHATLLDYGLAHEATESALSVFTKFDSTLGTIAYMAPEQGKGVRRDYRVDLYAVGVVAREMLTGEVADRFWFLDENKLSEKHDPYGLHAVINRMVATLDTRYRSAAEVRDALRALDHPEVQRVFAEERRITPSVVDQEAVVSFDEDDSLDALREVARAMGSGRERLERMQEMAQDAIEIANGSRETVDDVVSGESDVENERTAYAYRVIRNIRRSIADKTITIEQLDSELVPLLTAKGYEMSDISKDRKNIFSMHKVGHRGGSLQNITVTFRERDTTVSYYVPGDNSNSISGNAGNAKSLGALDAALQDYYPEYTKSMRSVPFDVLTLRERVKRVRDSFANGKRYRANTKDMRFREEDKSELLLVLDELGYVESNLSGMYHRIEGDKLQCFDLSPDQSKPRALDYFEIALDSIDTEEKGLEDVLLDQRKVRLVVLSRSDAGNLKKALKAKPVRKMSRQEDGDFSLEARMEDVELGLVRRVGNSVGEYLREHPSVTLRLSAVTGLSSLVAGFLAIFDPGLLETGITAGSLAATYTLDKYLEEANGGPTFVRRAGDYLKGKIPAIGGFAAGLKTLGYLGSLSFGPTSLLVGASALAGGAVYYGLKKVMKTTSSLPQSDRWEDTKLDLVKRIGVASALAYGGVKLYGYLPTVADGSLEQFLLIGGLVVAAGGLMVAGAKKETIAQMFNDYRNRFAREYKQLPEVTNAEVGNLLPRRVAPLAVDPEVQESIDALVEHESEGGKLFVNDLEPIFAGLGYEMGKMALISPNTYGNTFTKDSEVEEKFMFLCEDGSKEEIKLISFHVNYYGLRSLRGSSRTFKKAIEHMQKMATVEEVAGRFIEDYVAEHSQWTGSEADGLVQLHKQLSRYGWNVLRTDDLALNASGINATLRKVFYSRKKDDFTYDVVAVDTDQNRRGQIQRFTVSSFNELGLHLKAENKCSAAKTKKNLVEILSPSGDSVEAKTARVMDARNEVYAAMRQSRVIPGATLDKLRGALLDVGYREKGLRKGSNTFVRKNDDGKYDVFTITTGQSDTLDQLAKSSVGYFDFFQVDYAGRFKTVRAIRDPRSRQQFSAKYSESNVGAVCSLEMALTPTENHPLRDAINTAYRIEEGDIVESGDLVRAFSSEYRGKKPQEHPLFGSDLDLAIRQELIKHGYVQEGYHEFTKITDVEREGDLIERFTQRINLFPSQRCHISYSLESQKSNTIPWFSGRVTGEAVQRVQAEDRGALDSAFSDLNEYR